MASKTVAVGSAIGLHARPARIIAEAAQEYEHRIVLTFNGQSVVAESPLLIMSLGAEHGAEVTVSSNDANATEAIASLLSQDLDDED